MSSDDHKTYTPIRGSDGRPCVSGPGWGFGYDAGTLWPSMRLSTDADARAASRIANEAYRQGREQMRRDILNLLGAASK